jgi:hypothetical protein
MGGSGLHGVPQVDRRVVGAVAGLLLDGYTAAGREGGGVELAGHPAWRMFRLRRLVHELAYAYAHDRAYHAAINLRHAVEA